MRIGVVVVLFEPEDSVINNISQYIRDDILLCAVDNSKDKNDFPYNSHYVHNANIGGIAGAFNRGIEYLISQNCDYIFTFDQDSVLPANFFSSMNQFIKEKNAKMVVPDFIDINSKTHAAFVTLSRWKYKVTTESETTAFAISSGMGFSASAWKTIGTFSEEYIIDHVDTELCLKAAEHNIEIYINYDICLEHQIGNRTVHKFLGVTLKPNHHNYKRKYYIVRNGTHLGLKYFSRYPSYFYLNILRIIHETLCVILYEKDKSRKLKYMFKGLIHSFSNKLGPI
ncbi:glycosyltransferase [Raoultella ornithinolytica]|uniref:glycosyltransferase n=1 Tax=Raoultella ornithinolytica TaxID=54291 RepID=UPI001EF8A4A2|nr:glycosyltransferase [Raoultella ornithinolytica]ULI44112.1 glycosyltransferase [Raoultella ornithinolytica]HDT3906315.1 glycosyltransferase [Raoultella ornithinolytica]HDX8322163.1 glycosyltransferase [Raoultella ornithinolytica]HDX8333835.1 glycosyltransferase [Raoultella ornithinolytica]